LQLQDKTDRLKQKWRNCCCSRKKRKTSSKIICLPCSSILYFRRLSTRIMIIIQSGS
jgi:hypothetical protein